MLRLPSILISVLGINLVRNHIVGEVMAALGGERVLDRGDEQSVDPLQGLIRRAGAAVSLQ